MHLGRFYLIGLLECRQGGRRECERPLRSLPLGFSGTDPESWPRPNVLRTFAG